MDWMIYGANGYTGRLIAHEAARRGLRPVLAGRDAAAVERLATLLGLPWRAFALDNDAAVREGLNHIGLLLNCAGPFSATCAPMLRGCLAARAHYLDITGEIDVFEHCHMAHADAKLADIVVLPGAGFDVVPTDCLAAILKRDLPDADTLVLAFEAGGGPSPGTAATSVEGLGKGGRVRKQGQVRRVPLAWKVRQFERDGEARTAVTIPWGDVYTAYLSTGIPDIEVYMVVPPATVARLRRLRLLGPLLGWGPVQALLKRQVRKKVRGPSEQARERTGCVIWGIARNAAGRSVQRILRTPNGYDLTVSAALGIVEHLLRQSPPPPGGFYTPSKLMGADFVLGLPGVRLEEAVLASPGA
ncbi:saccharopine dehydrogenase family protein [Rehaibacterium terrae]|jgi:short subunit dehydrogenase-like uncharacterized protein|uniref:Short subunit dehydrogenase-like uncharacterized protein n=1 Tax=Rehaibacterium terrae TaxID=1341696 RepID=A0A7W7XYB0_9GAMM|nr:saccharopine dehydrogenase NADP-binding domain-containing protein [Rehaibacterium terrae]MBB5014212.1 short subunit dehydrogenase-like uncharacterized protein [Rehaibacterium terrae]